MTAHNSEQMQKETFSTSRRSWLASLTTGIAAFVSLPVWAHDTNSETNVKTRSFADLSKVQARNVVKKIDCSSGAYRVWTADGACTEFAAADLRFAIDSTPLGPATDRPVLWPSGQGRDRALVFFSAPNEIAAFVTAFT